MSREDLMENTPDTVEIVSLEDEDFEEDDDDTLDDEYEPPENVTDREVIRRYLEDEPERFMNFVDMEFRLDGPEVLERILEYLTDE